MAPKPNLVEGVDFHRYPDPSVLGVRHTLAGATKLAAYFAADYGYRHYVTETMMGEPQRGLDGDSVMYGWCDDPSLQRSLLLANDYVNVVRVAHPNGVIEAVEDPRDLESRLAAFCYMTDEGRDALWAETLPDVESEEQQP